IGMLELLSYSKLTADQREMLSAARGSSRSLLALIDDVLDFSKIEVGKLEIHREPCSVGRLMDAVSATFKHVASAEGLLLTPRKRTSRTCPKSRQARASACRSRCSRDRKASS